MENGLDQNMNDTITIVFRDGEFNLTRQQAERSLLFKNTLDQEPTATRIPVMNNVISVDDLKLIYPYIQHHETELKEIKLTPIINGLEDVCEDKWDIEWINKVWHTNPLHLHRMVYASNFLDMKQLLNLCCSKVADLIRGKDVAEHEKILVPVPEIQAFIDSVKK